MAASYVNPASVSLDCSVLAMIDLFVSSVYSNIGLSSFKFVSFTKPNIPSPKMQLSLQVSSVSKREALTNEDYEDYCFKFAWIIMQRLNDHLVGLMHRSNYHFIVNTH